MGPLLERPGLVRERRCRGGHQCCPSPGQWGGRRNGSPSGKRSPGSNPTATRIGSLPIPPGEGPQQLRANSQRRSQRGSYWRWPFTKIKSAALSKASCGGWSRHGKRPRRSQPSRTASCFPQGRTPRSIGMERMDGVSPLRALEPHSAGGTLGGGGGVRETLP